MRTIIIILFLFFRLISSAQKESPIVTDRPDQSDGGYVLPKSLVQLENGILFNYEGVINNFMMRYGWSRNSEIRMALDFGKINSQFSLLPVQFSIKQKLLNQKGTLPTITLIGYLSLGHLASKNVYDPKTERSLLLAFQHELSDKMGIECNFGSQSFKNDLRFTFLYSFKVLNNVTAFIEYFSDYEKSIKTYHNADIGILFTVTNDFHVDIGFGGALHSTYKSTFLTFGASHRFQTTNIKLIK